MTLLPQLRSINRAWAQKGFSRLLESVNHLLWPTICLGCRTRKDELDTFLCDDCWRDLMAACGGDYCPHCGRQASRFGRIGDRCGDCQDRQVSFDGIARAGVYGGSLRQIILSMKFQDRGELAEPLVRILNAALQSASFADFIDWFVPVPLHWRRRLSRGFNQSRMLAKGLVHPPPSGRSIPPSGDAMSAGPSPFAMGTNFQANDAALSMILPPAMRPSMNVPRSCVRPEPTRSMPSSWPWPCRIGMSERLRFAGASATFEGAFNFEVPFLFQTARILVA